MRVMDGAMAPLAVALVLLAGCSSPAAPLFPPTDHESHALPVRQAPGVTLVAHVTGGGRTLLVHAEAHNGGSETFLVPNACTGQPDETANATSPFSIAARRTSSETGDFPIHPARGCSEVATTPFAPGETVEFDVVWDGTFWSEAFERQTRVLPGPHVIDVALELYVGPDARPAPMVASVPIEVLDT